MRNFILYRVINIMYLGHIKRWFVSKLRFCGQNEETVYF